GLAVGAGIPAAAAAAVILVVAVLSATHDIASDGFYLEALDRADQARFSGWIVAAYRLALLTGGGLLGSIARTVSWAVVFLLAALTLGGLALWHGGVLPRPDPALEPDGVERPALLSRTVEAFHSFLRLPGIALAVAFIVFFKLGDALLFGMSTPFLLDAGMTKAQLGVAAGVLGAGVAIGRGMAGGGVLSVVHLEVHLAARPLVLRADPEPGDTRVRARRLDTRGRVGARRCHRRGAGSGRAWNGRLQQFPDAAESSGLQGHPLCNRDRHDGL